MGKKGRRHQGDPAASLGEFRQDRLKQRQLADAAFFHQELGEFPLGPAAPREFGIQLRVATGDAFPEQAGLGVAAPDVAPGEDIA